MSPDRRLRVLEAALFNPDLSYGERAFMTVVCTIKPEYLDGERRHGSKAMGPDGKFSLHLDYLAGALGTGTDGVRKVRRKLEAAEVLQLVHDGTFGRPATWEARVVRVAKSYSLTSGQNGHPYGFAEWLTRVAEMAPLTYKTPTNPDHPPSSGDPLADPIAERRSEEDVTSSAASRPTVCVWHDDQACPDDCANHPANRRRSA